MTTKAKNVLVARCTCGQVEIEMTGPPIIGAACYCDDCQAAARKIEALPDASRVLESDGATEFLLFRKDRVQVRRGAERLDAHKLKPRTPTRRMVATCCNTAMYLDFRKGHWFSIYRARVGSNAPPLELRIQTRFMPEGFPAPTDVPTYRRFPLRFIGKLLAARLAMAIGR